MARLGPWPFVLGIAALQLLQILLDVRGEYMLFCSQGASLYDKFVEGGCLPSIRQNQVLCVLLVEVRAVVEHDRVSCGGLPPHQKKFMHLGVFGQDYNGLWAALRPYF